ncbi:MAG: metallophosphoesterase [Fimbriimonadaceae bacterium]|nr:metallophosphoesterase [Fimbriimonadaceae bacterium]
MKLGLVSDSHDHLTALSAAAEVLRQAGVEQILHAGDFVAPFALPPLQTVGVPVTAVFGNNDGERLFLKSRCDAYGWSLTPKFAFPVFDDCAIALHHEDEPVAALAASGLYQLVVYGHTHAVDLRQHANGCWIINPGELCGWLTGRRTLVLFDTTTGQPELVELP